MLVELLWYCEVLSWPYIYNFFLFYHDRDVIALNTDAALSTLYYTGGGTMQSSL